MMSTYKPLVNEEEVDPKAALKLQSKAAEIPATVGYPAAPREWDGHFCECCGPRCDAAGWVACWISSHAWPACCLFGWNHNRAFGRSAWRAGMLFFALFFALHWALWISGNVLIQSVLQPCNPPADGTTLTEDEADALDACMGAVVGVLVVYELMVVGAAMIATYYAAKNRTELRERFGIPGSRTGDFCAWLWCIPCVLSQETRTLWLNNVQDGVWHGPTPRYPAAMTAAPAPVQMGHPAEENV